ncbi:MAG TPA: hypothetical protein VNM14_10345 [Planctomycetota bacterium]|jgi:hypothetical protein|nr:hypothetical protein [Planctomycetota bacterium]
MKWFLLIAFLVLVAATTAFFFLKPAPPPVGVARFRPSGSKGSGLAATPYTGNFALPMTVQYAGPRKGFDWNTQTWVKGTPAPISCHSHETLEDARQNALFSIRNRNTDSYAVGYSFHRSGLLGGSASGGGTFSEYIPDKSSPWIAVVSPRGPVDVPDGPRVALWGIVGHRERLDLPPDAPLEAWASKADWAILIGVQLNR